MKKDIKTEHYDNYNLEHVEAYKKIKNFNYVKDETLKLLLELLDSKSTSYSLMNSYIINGEFFIAFNSRSCCYYVGANDIYTRFSGSIIRFDEDLTDWWRKTMIGVYGNDYKQQLIKVLNQRKEETCQEFDKQIEEFNSL